MTRRLPFWNWKAWPFWRPWERFETSSPDSSWWFSLITRVFKPVWWNVSHRTTTLIWSSEGYAPSKKRAMWCAGSRGFQVSPTPLMRFLGKRYNRIKVFPDPEWTWCKFGTCARMRWFSQASIQGKTRDLNRDATPTVKSVSHIHVMFWCLYSQVKWDATQTCLMKYYFTKSWVEASVFVNVALGTHRDSVLMGDVAAQVSHMSCRFFVPPLLRFQSLIVKWHSLQLQLHYLWDMCLITSTWNLILTSWHVSTPLSFDIRDMRLFSCFKGPVGLMAQLVWRHSCVADRLPVVVRIPAGPWVRLGFKRTVPQSINGRTRKKKIMFRRTNTFLRFLTLHQFSVIWFFLFDLSVPHHVELLAVFPNHIATVTAALRVSIQYQAVSDSFAPVAAKHVVFDDTFACAIIDCFQSPTANWPWTQSTWVPVSVYFAAPAATFPGHCGPFARDRPRLIHTTLHMPTLPSRCEAWTETQPPRSKVWAAALNFWCHIHYTCHVLVPLLSSKINNKTIIRFHPRPFQHTSPQYSGLDVHLTNMS